MTDLYIQSDGRDMTVWHDRGGNDLALLTEHAADPALWAHLKATLPTRDDPQPEPTDPAVRVRDGIGEVWARVGERWVNASGDVRLWHELTSNYGPLEVIQPATDAEPEVRPFPVGTRVQISDDATVTTLIGQMSPKYRGHAGKVVGMYDADDGKAWNRVRLDGIAGEKQIAVSNLVRLEVRP